MLRNNKCASENQYVYVYSHITFALIGMVFNEEDCAARLRQMYRLTSDEKLTLGQYGTIIYARFCCLDLVFRWKTQSWINLSRDAHSVIHNSSF